MRGGEWSRVEGHAEDSRREAVSMSFCRPSQACSGAGTWGAGTRGGLLSDPVLSLRKVTGGFTWADLVLTSAE